MLEHYQAYRHNTEYDEKVLQGYRGYNYNLESLLRHGSIAFKKGVIVQRDQALAGCIVCRIISPEGKTFHSSINLMNDLAALLPNEDDMLDGWSAITVRRYGEKGSIQDLV